MKDEWVLGWRRVESGDVIEVERFSSGVGCQAEASHHTLPIHGRSLVGRSDRSSQKMHTRLGRHPMSAAATDNVKMAQGKAAAAQPLPASPITSPQSPQSIFFDR